MVHHDYGLVVQWLVGWLLDECPPLPELVPPLQLQRIALPGVLYYVPIACVRTLRSIDG